MLQYPRLAALSVALGLILTGPLQAAGSAQEKDSVYSWGRWEVLAPAAGGVPSVSAMQIETGVELRPGDAASLTPGFEAAESPSGPAVDEPVVVPNPPDSPPPVGDPRTDPPVVGEPIVVPNPPDAPPPTGGPRG